MAAGGAYLAVARVRKPHGLKGDLVVWVLTDDPETVFSPGRQLMPVDEQGQPIDDPVTIERSRQYHRQWLLKFEGVHERATLDTWRERLYGVEVSELTPPAEGEMYEHEVPGADVVVVHLAFCRRQKARCTNTKCRGPTSWSAVRLWERR